LDLERSTQGGVHVSDPSSNGSGTQAHYRFRVRLPDGTDHWSETFDAPKSASSSALGAPRWSNQHYGHGQRAILEVPGTGLDGRKVKFLVEQHQGDSWVPYSEAIAVMRNGVARAAVHLEHPAKGADAEKASPARLRFRCVIVGAPAQT